MAEVILAVGARYGSVVLVHSLGNPGNMWLVHCDCGGTAEYRASDLSRGRRKTCGHCMAVRFARGVGYCTKCKLEKPVAQFQARPSRGPTALRSWCNECCALELRESYRKDLDFSRARRRHYERANGRSPDRKPQSYALDPAKHLAHAAVSRALQKGILVRPVCCERCGATGRVEGHHDDYTRQLDVLWLCTMCHRARHAELKAVGRDPAETAQRKAS